MKQMSVPFVSDALVCNVLRNLYQWSSIHKYGHGQIDEVVFDTITLSGNKGRPQLVDAGKRLSWVWKPFVKAKVLLCKHLCGTQSNSFEKKKFILLLTNQNRFFVLNVGNPFPRYENWPYCVSHRFAWQGSRVATCFFVIPCTAVSVFNSTFVVPQWAGSVNLVARLACLQWCMKQEKQNTCLESFYIPVSRQNIDTFTLFTIEWPICTVRSLKRCTVWRIGQTGHSSRAQTTVDTGHAWVSRACSAARGSAASR